MKNGRPNLGYSNLHLVKLDHRRRRSPVIIEEEVLSEPVVIPLDGLEEKILMNSEREQLKKLSDTFCPADLTRLGEQAILLTSPTKEFANAQEK